MWIRVGTKIAGQLRLFQELDCVLAQPESNSRQRREGHIRF
jgi:hypothetical protein